MRLEDLVQRIDHLIAMGQSAVLYQTPSPMGASVPGDKYSEFKATSLSFLDQVFGSTKVYSVQFRVEVSNTLVSSVNHGIGILQGARGELVGGWLVTTRGLISAELFADFLEMAEYLLTEQYKDAAAVMVGGTLEEHLRQLATGQGIPVEEEKNGKMVPRKADVINAELAKSIYGKLDQKNVTAWLDLRNKAAHGKYSEYNEDQARSMLVAVREFIGRVRVT